MIEQKIKSTFISIAVVAVLFGGLIWFSRSGIGTSDKSVDVKSLSKGVLAAEETSFDFGTVSMAKGKVSHMFKLKNNSGDSAMVSKVYTSCMCTNATLIHGDKKMGPFGMPGHGFVPKVNDVVNSGEEADVEVVFDPAAHGPAGVGRIDRVVFVETESGLPLQLKFTAVVTP